MSGAVTTASCGADKTCEEKAAPSATLQMDYSNSLSLPLVQQPQNQDDIEHDVIYANYFKAQAACMETANKCLAKLKVPAMDATQGNHDWNSVSNKMEQACSALEKVSARDKDLSGARGKMKAAFRSFCRFAGAGKVIASLIPNDLCGSVLCGGLGVIFTALEQTSFHREAVFKALERLPRVLENHAEYTDLAGEDEEIHRRTAKLYTEVCLTIDHILRWFLMDAFVAGAKRLLNSSSFSTSLTDRMAEVSLAAKDLKARGTQVMWRQMKEMSTSQKWMAYENVKLGRQLDGIEQEIKRLIGRSASYQSIEKAVQANLQPLLQGVMQRLAITNQPRQPGATISTEGMLEELKYDRTVVGGDIQALLRLNLPTATIQLDQSRIRSFEAGPRVRAWLTIDEGSLLLVNGRSEALDLSTSFAVAKMVGSVMQPTTAGQEAMSIVPLAYFCSQHRDYYRDAAASPVELAVSLLLQLVDGYSEFDPTEIREQLLQTDFGDIGSVCSSFGQLLRMMSPSTVVFLVIDGLSFFNTPAKRMEGLREVIIQLVKTHRQHATPILKMMFISATRFRALEDLFEEEEILNLPTIPSPLGTAPLHV